MKSKIPPNNLDAEKNVLGAVLFDNDALMKVSGIIEEGDFYEPANRKIFKVMCEVSGRIGRIDLVTLAEALLVSGDLEIVGGPAYLMDLMEITPTATAIVYHAKIVKEKAQLRKLIAISTQLNLDAYGEGVSVEKLLENADKKLYDIRGDSGGHDNKWTSLSDSRLETFDNIERIYNTEDGDIENLGYITTGFNDLDDQITGLFNGEMTVVAARPSQGKTSFCFNIAVNVAKRGIPVAIFSIETSTDKSTERIICSEAQVSSHAIHKKWLYDKDWPKLVNAVGSLSDIPLFIHDAPTLSLQEFRARTKRIIKDKGAKLIIIDYLTLMHIKGARDNRVMYSDISRAIKATAREYNIPIVVLSQLSREVEKRKPPRPMLSDLRETGAIEQDADTVMLLYRPAAYTKKLNDKGEEDETTEVIVKKQRNGPTGTVKMEFVRKYTRFVDIREDYFE